LDDIQIFLADTKVVWYLVGQRLTTWHIAHIYNDVGKQFLWIFLCIHYSLAKNLEWTEREYEMWKDDYIIEKLCEREFKSHFFFFVKGTNLSMTFCVFGITTIFYKFAPDICCATTKRKYSKYTLLCCLALIFYFANNN
jgi:hypothetical protein